MCKGNDIKYTYKWALADKKEELPKLTEKQTKAY